MKMMWEILVPTEIRLKPGKYYSTIYHKVWDSKVRKISNGLTIMPPARGQWISPTGELFQERIKAASSTPLEQPTGGVPRECDGVAWTSDVVIVSAIVSDGCGAVLVQAKGKKFGLDDAQNHRDWFR